MATPPATEITLMLQQGIAAARSSRSAEARHLLEKVVKADPDNEMAWLWLSGLVTTNERKRTCLENVLRTNPENVYARAGLTRLQETPLLEADELEARLAFVTNGDSSPSPTADPLQASRSKVRPPLKRLKAPRAADAQQSDASQNGLDASESVEPTRQRKPNHTSEPTCPACDEPISPTAKMCPYCFMPFRSLEELLGYDPQNSLNNSPPAYKRKRRNIFGHLGSIISS